jgi:hypothetical protein
VPFQHEDAQTLAIPVTLGPCDGKLLMAVQQPIAGLSVSGPERATRGQPWTGQVRVLDDGGKPVDAVIPLQVEVFDGDGRIAEFSGHYGAVGGTLELKLDIAANDEPGTWEVRVRELASGRRESRFFRVGE